MSIDEQRIEPGSEMDAAIERALQAANLRAGGSTDTGFVVEISEPSAAAEAGGVDAPDGD